MNQQEQKITPSRESRILFGIMQARSVLGALSLEQTIELAAERVKSGKVDKDEIHQLLKEKWISCAPDGGWLLLDNNHPVPHNQD